jgi:hypothetical protein
LLEAGGNVALTMAPNDSLLEASGNVALTMAGPRMEEILSAYVYRKRLGPLLRVGSRRMGQHQAWSVVSPEILLTGPRKRKRFDPQARVLPCMTLLAGLVSREFAMSARVLDGILSLSDKSMASRVVDATRPSRIQLVVVPSATNCVRGRCTVAGVATAPSLFVVLPRRELVDVTSDGREMNERRLVQQWTIPCADMGNDSLRTSWIASIA